MQHLWYYLITINAVAFLLMLIDKRSSRKKLWRIPEAWLLTIAVLGGSLGTTVGMFVFRHKTKHVKFAVGFPVILLIHIGILLCYFT